MNQGFRNETDWKTATLALVVWAAHFSLLWAASIIFPDQPAARWLALFCTLAAAGALFALWQRASRPGITSVAGLGLAIGAVGVAFGFAPAIVG